MVESLLDIFLCDRHVELHRICCSLEQLVGSSVIHQIWPGPVENVNDAGRRYEGEDDAQEAATERIDRAGCRPTVVDQ